MFVCLSSSERFERLLHQQSVGCDNHAPPPVPHRGGQHTGGRRPPAASGHSRHAGILWEKKYFNSLDFPLSGYLYQTLLQGLFFNDLKLSNYLK